MPYAPNVQPRGDHFLFQGMMGAASSIADAMEKRDEQAQQQIDGGKAVDFMLKASPQLKQRLGLTDKEIGALGPREKIAMGTGLMKSMAMEQIVGELSDAAQKRKALAETPGFTAAMGDMMAPGTGPAMPPLAAMGAASQRFPAAAAEMSPHLIQRLMPDPDGTGQQFKFDPKTMIQPLPGGGRYVQTSKGGGQLDLTDLKQKSATDLLNARLANLPVKDHYNALNSQLKSLIAAKGVTINPNMVPALDEEIQAVQAKMAELEAGRSKGGGAAGGGMDPNDPLGLRRK